MWLVHLNTVVRQVLLIWEITCFNDTVNIPFSTKVTNLLPGFISKSNLLFFFYWYDTPSCARNSSLSSLHDHTQTHYTRQNSSGRVIIGCRDLYLTTYSTHKTETSIISGGIQTLSPSKWVATDLRLTVTGMDIRHHTEREVENLLEGYTLLCVWFFFFCSLHPSGSPRVGLGLYCVRHFPIYYFRNATFSDSYNSVFFFFFLLLLFM